MAKIEDPFAIKKKAEKKEKKNVFPEKTREMQGAANGTTEVPATDLEEADEVDELLAAQVVRPDSDPPAEPTPGKIEAAKPNAAVNTALQKAHARIIKPGWEVFGKGEASEKECRTHFEQIESSFACGDLTREQHASLKELLQQRQLARLSVELQADCFAGVWGHQKGASLAIDETDLREALNAAHAIGDDTLGHRDARDHTHGTSEQRMRWFRKGFDSGEPRACDTFAVASP